MTTKKTNKAPASKKAPAKKPVSNQSKVDAKEMLGSMLDGLRQVVSAIQETKHREQDEKKQDTDTGSINLSFSMTFNKDGEPIGHPNSQLEANNISIKTLSRSLGAMVLQHFKDIADKKGSKDLLKKIVGEVSNMFTRYRLEISDELPEEVKETLSKLL